ncbi:MAG: glycoside hydrolase family 88 protein [Candidatus Symbiothrix sp.]|jgi:rhamnogalacturonyl hydrolase YesR|nr:glycoside hydrolase family 88 protein [Candidatus Symbiothrix sp.]
MKKIILSTICGLLLASNCGLIIAQPKIVKENVAFADKQLTYSLEQVKAATTDKLNNPRTIKDGKLSMAPSWEWTSGFYPGILWYMYEYTNNPKWLQEARHFTKLTESQQFVTNTHDMGFKMYCGYGNGYRLTGDTAYQRVLIQSANTLITRYNPTVGLIRSWDFNKDRWQYPVIIDNMMNLELLFWATKATGDSTYYHIAYNHAKKTIENHFRADNSSFHVVDYDTISGQSRLKQTWQGYADGSAWARGQGWGLYGYTLCYRATGDKSFLEQAKKIEKYIFSHPNMPKDLVPYWDFNDPDIPNTPRDASAAAIYASALYELSTYVSKTEAKDYLKKADKIIESLSSPAYRSPLNENFGFLLLHSTGAKPFKSEVDEPLVYADYYFLEALLRKNSFAAKR